MCVRGVGALCLLFLSFGNAVEEYVMINVNVFLCVFVCLCVCGKVFVACG